MRLSQGIHRRHKFGVPVAIMKLAMDHGDHFFVTSLRARSSGASLIACVEGSLHFSRAISLPDFVNDRFTIRLVN
jgi:hypothetical protein